MSFRKALLLGLLAGTFHAPIFAQDSAPAAASDPDLDESDVVEDEIVVTGQRERGAVIGDIEPEVQLNRAEIRSFGASNLGELLAAIAPQTSSGRGRDGGGPVVLLNGRRISGFSEIRGIPPEAIVRVDILPEEVALKYGYRADQRVVNFVLRPRFRAVTAELEAGMPTAGGRSSYEADVNILRINDAGRMSLDLALEHDTPLFESERDLVQPTADDMLLAPFRTLLGESDKASINATLNRTIFGNVSATGNARFEATSSQSGLGLAQALDGSFDALRPLDRESDGRTSHLGVALNGDLSRWRWSFTGNFDRAVNTSRTDTDDGARDRSKSTNQSLGGELVANGTLVELPAGALSATFKAGAETRGFESETLRAGVAQARSLSRDRVEGQASFDLPIASRRRDILAGIGSLSANFNLAADHLSDFGTLTTLGYGLNWSPIDIVDVIASVTHEDGAPSVQQLGDPSTLTPNVRVFDFTRGETVDVARLDGGNPDLLADNRRVFKLGVTVKPLKKADLTLSANYTANHTRNVIASFPTATPEIEAAFPERFVRDGSGRLVQIDSRPTNFARADREEVRWGITFSKPIGPQGPPGGFGAARRGGGAGGATPGTPPTPGQSEGATAPSGERAQRGGGQGGGRGFGGPGGGRGGFGGGGRGGRLQLALYHTWRLEDSILIRDGVPELDLLNGSAVGNRGGRPRHEIEFQSGFTKNGLGARVSVNWQDGTSVRGVTSGAAGSTGDLFFSDLATVNLRLFADLGQQRALVRDNRWLRGTRVTLSVDNLFDSRLDVRDATGATPIGYQPDLLDPLGRSVRLSVRKLFF